MTSLSNVWGDNIPRSAVLLSSKMLGGLFYTENRLEQSMWRATLRSEGFNEYCNVEIAAPPETVEGIKCRTPPGANVGKADVLKSTVEAIGIGG